MHAYSRSHVGDVPSPVTSVRHQDSRILPIYDGVIQHWEKAITSEGGKERERDEP